MYWKRYITKKEIEEGSMDETEVFIAFDDIELSRVYYHIFCAVAEIYGRYNIYVFRYKSNIRKNGKL